MRYIRRSITAVTCALILLGSTQAKSDFRSAILPPQNDATANWKNAGMLSVGGIPTRSAVCTSLSPLGGDKDDLAQINNAIASCPAGSVLMLAAGTFTINEGNYISLNKGITLRGTGSCNNASSPYCSTVITMHGGAVMNSYTCGQPNCTYHPLIFSVLHYGPPLGAPRRRLPRMRRKARLPSE